MWSDLNLIWDENRNVFQEKENSEMKKMNLVVKVWLGSRKTCLQCFAKKVKVRKGKMKEMKKELQYEAGSKGVVRFKENMGG